jgi:5,10-methylenetetrahydromethanopterin reductase
VPRGLHIRTGVGLYGEMSLGQLAAAARQIEDLGYDDLWFGDERFYRDVYVCLAHVAHATRHLGLGVAVTNPYSRHPALTAVAAATLDELSGGRLKLGIGAGGSNHGPLGIRAEKPRTAIREMSELMRGLWRGQEVDYHGKVVGLNAGRLDFTPARAAIPLYIAARGPQTLKLAGEIADGAIIGALSSPAGVRYALDQVAQGAALARRRPDAVDTVAWLYTCIADDPEAARQAVGRLVVNTLQNSRDILEQIGVRLPTELAALFARTGWSQALPVVAEAARLLPAEIIDQFSLTGTVAQVARKLEGILDAGVREVAILPFAASGSDKLEVVRRFRAEVLPAVAG